jgi:hypothetical protein
MLLSIYTAFLIVTLAADLTTGIVTAENITDNATPENMTKGTIVTNGSN